MNETEQQVTSVTVTVTTWKKLADRKAVSVLDVFCAIWRRGATEPGEIVGFEHVGNFRRGDVRVCIFTNLKPEIWNDELTTVAFEAGLWDVKYYAN